MEVKTATTESLNNLLYLPGFAAHLLKENLAAFVQKQLQYAQELNLPLLRFFLNMPEERRAAIATQTTTEFLIHLAANKGAEHIAASMEQWKSNRLPVVDKSDIVAEDITLVNHVRKKALLDFVPGYTTDPVEIIELVKEIDLFTIQSVTESTNQYLDFFKQHLEENLHFIQKVAETIPGAVYVFDAENYKGIYSNNKLPDVIGYTQADLNELGKDAIATLIHPDDQSGLREQFTTIRNSSTDEPVVTKYRIRKKDGTYRWLANYESVFKRKADGEIWQTIGITLDIDKEQKALEELHNREQQLLEAQNIAQLGNYYWDLENKFSTGSPKTFELLEVEPNSFSDFLEKVHPEDRQKLRTAIEQAFTSGCFNCEYRLRGKDREKNIWGRGMVEYRDGQPVGMTGTVMDVTEHSRLSQKLAEADRRHKQAEALAHIGTYSRHLLTGEIEWSEEMYRIFELDTDTPLKYESLVQFLVPEDRQILEKTIAESIRDVAPFDFYYRMVTGSGKTKIIHSRGRVHLNEEGIADRLVGTDQDVTEKQTLIRRLQKSETLYRHAEKIADMGNWSWDVKNNKLEWTDHLYRIYGLAPQSEEITIDRFLSFLHPSDRDSVTQGVKELDRESSSDYTFRIIAQDGTEKWLRSIAQVLRNERGDIDSIVGTEQNVTEKQKLIGKLEESQRLYKQAQELAQMGNFSWDIQSGEVFWSDEVYKIYERPYGEKVQFDDAFLPIVDEHKENVKKAIEQTVADKKGLSISYAIRTGSDQLKYVNLHTDVGLAKDGSVACIIGTAQDVTEKEVLINRLRESQTFIQKITDATPSIIASYNVNTGKYTFISEGLEKLLGYATAEVLEKGTAFFEAILHPDDVPLLMEKNAQALQEANNGERKEIVAEFTYRMRHRDGRYRWFHTYGTVFDFNDDGKVEHILNITLDVTEQKEAVETIREKEYFIQQIADASPTILYLFDIPSQRMAYINREAFFVLGYLPEEIFEENSNITAVLYHPDDLHLLPARSQSRKNFQQLDSMIQYECRMKHKDGDYRWLLVREIVFKADETGTITQIIGAALDITRRKEMERTILQNANQLEQSNASLEEFAYVASHDLKEPLRKISTFGDRLMASQMDKLSDEGKIYLRKIVEASQRMQNMISDLLSISMISGNRQFETASLQKILEETLQTLEFKIEQQKAVVRYDALPDANVVPSQFRQLFQNLIANSLKFVREDVQPVVVIACSVVGAEDVADYQVAKAPSYLRLTVSDNGIGFENEYAQKIFAIFHRLHGRSEYEGSGIGLAICKKIVEHHGGVIFASGQPGVGATFTLIIPA